MKCFLGLIVIVLLSGCVDVIGTNSGGTTYNNYTNGSGGGISFNGSAVDMNGSSFYNGSQQAGTFNHSNLTKLNWKEANHTIDANIEMNSYGLTNVSFINNATYVNVSKTVVISNKTYTVFDTSNADIEIESDKNTVMRAVATGGGTNSFGANSAAGNLSNPSNVTNGMLIFNFFGAGYDGTTWTGSRAYIRIFADNTWNSTHQKTKTVFATSNTASAVAALTIKSDGNITLPALAGSGNDYVCVDPDGTLFRSDLAC